MHLVLPLCCPPCGPSPPRLWSYGLQCLKLGTYSGEARELYEHFAEVFASMEPRDFVEVRG